MAGGWSDRIFGFDDGQHRGHVEQIAWRRLALEIGVFLAVLLVGRLVTGEGAGLWARIVVVAVAIAAMVAVRRRAR